MKLRIIAGLLTLALLARGSVVTAQEVQEAADNPYVDLQYIEPVPDDDWLSPHFYLTDGLQLDIRTGAVFPLGQGALEQRVTAAWRLEASLSQPLRGLPSPCFWEIGLGITYWDGDGEDIPTSGKFRPSLFAPPQPLERFYDTSLERIVQRYGFFAIGTRFGGTAPFDGVWQLTSRLGVRIGAARARFDNRPSPALEATVAAARAGGASPDAFVFNSDVNPSDTFVGLFGTIGVESRWHDVWLGSWHLGDVVVGFELEFSHDWMDFGDFNRDDSGIGGVGTMIHVGLYH